MGRSCMGPFTHGWASPHQRQRGRAISPWMHSHSGHDCGHQWGVPSMTNALPRCCCNCSAIPFRDKPLCRWRRCVTAGGGDGRGCAALAAPRMVCVIPVQPPVCCLLVPVPALPQAPIRSPEGQARPAVIIYSCAARYHGGRRPGACPRRGRVQVRGSRAVLCCNCKRWCRPAPALRCCAWQARR